MPNDSSGATKTDSPPSAASAAELMDERVSRLKTPQDCLIFAKNATDRARLDLACQARRRLIFLRVEEQKPDTPLQRAWFEALYAHEEALAQRDRKPARPSPTRIFLRKYGARAAIERSLAAKGSAEAYAMLKANGLQDFSFENAVVHFPEEFSPEILERARTNLAAWN